MGQEIAWWQVILASSVVATFVGGWIGHLSAARLFKLQSSENKGSLRIQIAKEYYLNENRERKKLNSLLFAKVGDARSAIFSKLPEEMFEPFHSLTSFYQENYLMFGFDKSDHENMRQFTTNLFQLRHIESRVRVGQGKDVANMMEKTNKEFEENFKKVTDAIFQKSDSEFLAEEALNYSNLTFEKAKQETKSKGDD